MEFQIVVECLCCTLCKCLTDMFLSMEEIVWNPLTLHLQGHDLPIEYGLHSCKVSPQSPMSPIPTCDLSSKSPCSSLSR